MPGERAGMKKAVRARSVAAKASRAPATAPAASAATATATADQGFEGFARRLGPGLITGAADDDPSGIATYSQAGAQFRFAWSGRCS
jgi:hypothetical protein